MWNRSYRWQRRARVGAGVCLLLAAVVGIAFAARTAPARRARIGARDAWRELTAPSEELVRVAAPQSLGVQVGTLVYLDRADGVAQVIGRVVSVAAPRDGQVEIALRLMGDSAAAGARGGVLRGAPATLTLRDALRLMVSPNTTDEELAIARDAIWPSVETHVLPNMVEGLIRETSRELAAARPPENGSMARSLDRLRSSLAPLEDELADRLAKRAWDVVGFGGLASGVWRMTADGMRNSGDSVADWSMRLFGKPRDPDDEFDRSFFSPETSEELREALADETVAFWAEHRATIVEALSAVIAEQRPDLEASFQRKWARMLYERAVAPAWLSGQDAVLEAVQLYANDFTERRLLTSQGGPRLPFAYALRSSLKISDAPLLVFSPNPSDAPTAVVYEPMLR